MAIPAGITIAKAENLPETELVQAATCLAFQALAGKGYM